MILRPLYRSLRVFGFKIFFDFFWKICSEKCPEKKFWEKYFELNFFLKSAENDFKASLLFISRFWLKIFFDFSKKISFKTRVKKKKILKIKISSNQKIFKPNKLKAISQVAPGIPESKESGSTT